MHPRRCLPLRVFPPFSPNIFPPPNESRALVLSSTPPPSFSWFLTTFEVVFCVFFTYCEPQGSLISRGLTGFWARFFPSSVFCKNVIFFCAPLLPCDCGPKPVVMSGRCFPVFFFFHRWFFRFAWSVSNSRLFFFALICVPIFSWIDPQLGPLPPFFLFHFPPLFWADNFCVFCRTFSLGLPPPTDQQVSLNASYSESSSVYD